MNATEIAATLSVRAAGICSRYLPCGRKQGRYGAAGDTNGAKGRSLFVRLALRAYPRNGPAPRPTRMDICSISSVCAPAEDRCAATWRRPSRSSHCRRPLPPMAAPPRACSAPGSIPSDLRKSQPREPSQSAWARPWPGRALRRVRLRRDPACRRGHRNRAVTGHRCPRHSCRRRLYQRAAWAPSNHPKTSPCWSSPAIKIWRAGTPQTVFSAVAWNAAFPQS